jgi:hypothetical protein
MKHKDYTYENTETNEEKKKELFGIKSADI